MLRRAWTAVWDHYGRIMDGGYPVPYTVLSMYRIALGSYMLILNAIPDLRWIGSYPGVFYDPAPGMPAMWRGFLPYWALVSLEVLLILVICGMLIGWRTPLMSVAVTVVGYTANSAYFTFGKIDHTFMLWIVPGLLAFSGWGRHFSADAARSEPADEDEIAPSWPVVAVGAFLAVSFLTAAMPKILRGWLSFETSAVRRHFLQLSYQLERDQLLAQTFRDFDFQPFWEALDWAGIGLELALAFALFWPFAQRWLIFAAWIFHLANLLLLNISFYGPLAVYPLFFLPLLSPELGAKAGNFLMRHKRIFLPLVPVLALLAFFAQGLWWFVTQDLLQLQDRTTDLSFFIFGFAIIVLIGIKSKGYRRTITA